MVRVEAHKFLNRCQYLSIDVIHMFRFTTPQITYEIGGVRVGGQPGENPPVLIGSIFYHGHKVVEDESKGVFNRVEAEGLIKTVEELSDKTKLPFMLDVVGSTPEAIVKFIEFTVGVTKAPILIDTLGSIEVSDVALRYVREVGLVSRVVYNSLTIKSKDDEFRMLRENNVKAAVYLLYTDKVMDMNTRLENLESLLKKGKEFGIEKVLVDTFVIDLPSLSVATRTAIEVKRRYGLPVGCGAHNAISTQRKAFKERFGTDGLRICELTSNLMTIVLGCDFILYGPIESSKDVFPAIYTLYTTYRYLLRRKESTLQL